MRTLSFGDASRQQCFPITIIDDSVREILATETLRVNLSVDPSQTQVTVVTPSVQVTILDEDGTYWQC